jgi:hypothetical protein
MTRLLFLVSLLYLLGEGLAWKAPGSIRVKKLGNSVAEPRAAFRAALSSVIVSSVLLGAGVSINMGSFTGIVGNSAAVAAVGEGGLPDGIVAFQKLVKYQKDLDSVAESVKKRGSEMDNTEIQTLKIFMKQLANEYGDMEFLSRSINSEKDREAAKQIGKDLRVAAREVDKALSDQKVEVLTEKYPVMKKMVADFLAYLSDVPDEL